MKLNDYTKYLQINVVGCNVSVIFKSLKYCSNHELFLKCPLGQKNNYKKPQTLKYWC